MKKSFTLFITLILLLSLYACSSKPESADSPATSSFTPSTDTANYETALTICMDEYLYEVEYKSIFERFSNEHPEIELVFEFISLPTNEAQRQSDIERIRTALMAGSGPDIYIINTSMSYTERSSIFSDINLIKESGVFTDVIPLLESVDISVDEFIPVVMKAGQLDGKQFIVPLNYSANLVLTNDKTRELLGGDSAFQSASNFMDAALNLSRTPGTFSKTFLGADMSPRKITTFFNPFYMSSPPLIDYNTRTVTIDSAFTRDIMNKSAAINANVAHEYYNKNIAGSTPSEDTWKAWNNYIQSDKYIHIDNFYALLAQEAAYLDIAGVVPRLDILPSEDGGGCAVITSYAAVRANTQHQQEAAELLKLLLSDDVQSIGSISTTYMPVRKGLIPDIMGKFINSGLTASSAYYPPNGIYFFQAPMNDETLKQFSSIEESLTSARFRPPLEVNNVLLDYYSGQCDAESAIAEMQQYSSSALWSAT